MSTITTKDGTTIYYKDWGHGPVVTFSHGWPLSSDMWDGQMLFLTQHGFRCVAHDRRGHGRSSQASSRNDMDGYADDLAELIEALDLRGITMVGHSMSAGFAILIIGIPIFLLFLGATRGVALAEGRLVEAMLGTRMPRRPVSSAIAARSCSEMSAPVGLHGELMITPRVRGVTALNTDSAVIAKPSTGEVCTTIGVASASFTCSVSVGQYGA